jgi:cytoskeleton protein RodZ
MQTIGERLEEARKKKGISIREAAEATKIRGDYLQKFEGNHFDIGLTEIYTRGFLRTYANYLKLPADRILNDYAALGRGDIRPRQPNREIYGRMDISVSTAESADRAAPPPEPVAEPSPANRGPQRPRGGSSLPSGPDPAVIFKYVKIAGAVIIVVLLILVVKAIFSGGRSSGGSGQTNTAVRGPSITLIANRTVQVKVARPSAEDSEKDGEILYSGTMAAGESRVVSWPGMLFVEAEPPSGLDINVNGRRINLGQMLTSMGHPNLNRGKLPAPAP